MPRTLKVGDTADPITGTARATDPTTGTVVRVDLTVYETVEIHMKVTGAMDGIGGEVVVLESEEGADDSTDETDGLPVTRGKFRYAQTTPDVDTSGIYKTELKCTLSNGKVVHFPNAQAQNEIVTIDPNIDPA